MAWLSLLAGTAPAAGPQELGDAAEEDSSEVLDMLLDDELDSLLAGESADAGAGGAGRWRLEGWKGFVSLEPRTYLRDRDEGKADEQLLFETEFELDFRLSDTWTAYLRPRVFIDALDTELQRFEPYEAYVTMAGDGWDLRAGQFVENWGIADTYNPVDIMNRRDFGTDLLDPDRLGELGLRYRSMFEGGELVGEPTVSLYALPVFRRTLFAPEDQRYAPGTELYPFDQDGGFEPDGSEGALFAARAQATLSTGPLNADLQLIAARGPEHTPGVLPFGDVLAPVYYGVETLGAGIRAVTNEDTLGAFLAAFTFKAEIVHKSPYVFDDSPIDVPDQYLAYVFGLDRSFPGVFTAQDELTLTVEYAGEDSDEAPPTALFRPFRDDLILRAAWEANDFARQSLEVRGLIDLEVDERIYETIYERQLRSVHEDLKLTVQFQYFDAGEETLFDIFPDNTSLAVGLRFDF